MHGRNDFIQAVQEVLQDGAEPNKLLPSRLKLGWDKDEWIVAIEERMDKIASERDAR